MRQKIKDEIYATIRIIDDLDISDWYRAHVFRSIAVEICLFKDDDLMKNLKEHLKSCQSIVEVRRKKNEEEV